MRERRRTPTGGVQAEKQQRYVRLIAQGINNSEACRLVGIDGKTGNRWRYGRSVRKTGGEVVHYRPVKIVPATQRSPRYLSEHQRIVIADLLGVGRTVRAIARELGRSPSTFGREICRNRDARGRYRPRQAEHAARARGRRPRNRRVAVDAVLGDLVARRRRVRVAQRRGRLTAMRMIDERPVEVKDRMQAGHWEGDLIMGPGNRSAIGTLLERTTRFLILLHMPEGVPTAATVRHAVSSTFARLPGGLARTLTCDQGKELAQHPHITASTGTAVFFCDAHSPWQRRSNENMNGLLRHYFPKGTDLSVFSTTSCSTSPSRSTTDRARRSVGAGHRTCLPARWRPPDRRY